MNKKITEKQIETAYFTAIHCRDSISAKVVLEDICNRNKINYKYFLISINKYCKKNNLDYIFDSIYKRELNVLNGIISKDPKNLMTCFREYVSSTYPELTKPGVKNKKMYNKQVIRVSKIWYNKGRKNHVCFMTISKKGKAMINGKTSDKVNENYTNSFLKSLHVRVINFFKLVFKC